VRVAFATLGCRLNQVDSQQLQSALEARGFATVPFGAPADVPLRLAAELDSLQLAWRSSDKEQEDPVLEAVGSWQMEFRRRMLGDLHPATWARLLELSYDTLGYHEQNVSPRLNLECLLLECRRAS